MAVTLYQTAERPGLSLWLQDDNGVLVDLSSGYTFELKLGKPGSAATFTKTTGITGAAGSGTQTSGTPNVSVTFTSGELDSITTGPTTGQIRASTSGLDRFWLFPVRVAPVIS